MLVLSRKPGEKVIIEGGITMTLVQIDGGRVRLGFEAPDDVRILRGELADLVNKNERGPVAARTAPKG